MALAEHHPTMSVLRRDRDTRRIRRAAEAARVGPQSAMAAALAQIGAAFDEAAGINAFKMRVEYLLCLGPHHPAVRARFGARPALLRGRSLDAAIVAIARWRRDERKAFQIASVFGCATRLSLDVLCELHLILRLMRFKRMDAEFSGLVAVLCDEPIAIAAE